MEWTLLVLLVPFIIVPVVLLWGYAGCSFEARGYFPSIPADVTVTEVGPGFVALTWTHEAVAGVTFEVDVFKEQETVPVTLMSDVTSARAERLLPSTLYRFQVRALYGGFDTDPSSEVSATTLPPVRCFTSSLSMDQTLVEGFCLAQRLEPAVLAAGGFHVFITVRGPNSGSLVLDRVYISQPAAVGNPYDSAGDLTMVATAVSVPQGMSLPLPVVQYTLDPSRPLLVIFDINSTQGTVRNQSFVPASQATCFVKGATAEAAVADRIPNAANPGAQPYVVSDTIYLIETIDVA
ncbi:fibronectin type III domain protein [Roseimicrobium gellanilyticum]|uniref:Fibronectin type III domain protein n=1 Tax=Roseimicrobium gellanilyticum TaxID=748857 RepID=A0A366HPF3_9BACT|nr:fibronectin type III domain-containing protein [Roseimicrobium gellanilyticum]RBP45375.1 fibronectin type III domain protein [Roseimicrobium gellanilyticum]